MCFFFSRFSSICTRLHVLCHVSSSTFPHSFMCLPTKPVDSTHAFWLRRELNLRSCAFSRVFLPPYCSFPIPHEFPHPFPRCAFTHGLTYKFPCALHCIPCAFFYGFPFAFSRGFLMRFPGGSLCVSPWVPLSILPWICFLACRTGGLAGSGFVAMHERMLEARERVRREKNRRSYIAMKPVNPPVVHARFP